MSDELTQIGHMFNHTINMHIEHIATCMLCRRGQYCEMLEHITDVSNQLARRSFELQVQEMKVYFENRDTQ
jgi:hypothetical protein